MDRPTCPNDGCTRPVRSKGKQGWGKECWRCHAEKYAPYQLSKSTRTTKEARIAWSVKQKPCSRCGWDKAPVDAHRIDPAKGYTRKNTVGLCPNCHRLATLEAIAVSRGTVGSHHR